MGKGKVKMHTSQPHEALMAAAIEALLPLESRVLGNSANWSMLAVKSRVPWLLILRAHKGYRRMLHPLTLDEVLAYCFHDTKVI